MAQYKENMNDKFFKLMEQPEYARLHATLLNAMQEAFAAGWYAGQNPEDDNNPDKPEEK